MPQPPRPTRPSRWALPITAGAGFLAGLDTTAVNLALPDIQRDPRRRPRRTPVGRQRVRPAQRGAAGDGGRPERPVRQAPGLRGGPAGLRRRLGGLRPLPLGAPARSRSSSARSGGRRGDRERARGAREHLPARGTRPSARRLRAIAALSFVVGPLVGGMLTDLFGWRSVFLANVPVAALIAVAARATPPRASRAGRITQDGRGSTTPASRRSRSGSAHCCTPRSGATTSGGRRPRSASPPRWGSLASRRSSRSNVAPSTASWTSASSAIGRSRSGRHDCRRRRGVLRHARLPQPLPAGDAELRRRRHRSRLPADDPALHDHLSGGRTVARPHAGRTAADDRARPDRLRNAAARRRRRGRGAARRRRSAWRSPGSAPGSR